MAANGEILTIDNFRDLLGGNGQAGTLSSVFTLYIFAPRSPLPLLPVPEPPSTSPPLSGPHT
jgi:hypothetical protein